MQIRGDGEGDDMWRGVGGDVDAVDVPHGSIPR